MYLELALPDYQLLRVDLTRVESTLILETLSYFILFLFYALKLCPQSKNLFLIIFDVSLGYFVFLTFLPVYNRPLTYIYIFVIVPCA